MTDPVLTDPVLTAIATALATQGALAVAAGGKAVAAKLVALVKGRFAKEPSARAALEAATAEPEDETRVARLRTALDLVAQTDPAFAAELSRTWEETRGSQTAAQGGAINNVSGIIGGDAVQAHTVHGVRFGDREGR